MKKIKTTGKKARLIKTKGPKPRLIGVATIEQGLGAEHVGPAAREPQTVLITGPLEFRVHRPSRLPIDPVQQLAANNPFKRLGPVKGAVEFMLTVYWSGLNDGDDDGRGHLMQRGRVTADMGLENFPDPPPTAEEMREVMFAAKMAMLKVLRKRKRK